MLPIVSEDIFQNTVDEVLDDISGWRKSMIHYIKEENPEINSAIIELANKGGLDAKAVATGAYAVYKMLETASVEFDSPNIEE